MTSQSATAVVVICSSCQANMPNQVVGQLADAIGLAGLDKSVVVSQQACLNVCGSPIAVAIQGLNRATYVFGDVDLPCDTNDLLATLRSYLKNPDGWIEDGSTCGRLRHCLKARVMALPVSQALAGFD